MIGASEVENVSRSFSGGPREADKYAFSKSRPLESLAKEKDYSVVSSNLGLQDVSPKQSPCLLDDLPKQSSGLLDDSPKQSSYESMGSKSLSKHSISRESNIIVVVTIVFAIVVKLLQLTEEVITGVISVLKRPLHFQNKDVCYYSGAGSPDFSISISSNENSVIVKQSRVFKVATVKENNAAFQVVVEVFDNSDVAISGVLPNSVNNVVLKSCHDPGTPSMLHGKSVAIKANEKVSYSSPVFDDVNNETSGEEREVKGNVCSTEVSCDESLSSTRSYEESDSFGDICLPLVANDSIISVSIDGNDFACLVDSGAAVTAVNASVWRECLCHAYPTLDTSSFDSVTSVSGCPLVAIGRTSMPFVIESKVFLAEVHVIEDLAYSVIIGRDFLQKFGSKLDFANGMIYFSPENDPLPFNSEQPPSRDFNDAFVCSVHADFSFVVPPASEMVVFGKLNKLPQEKMASGFIAPRMDLPHRYSIFGASELVKVAEDGSVPVRMINPSVQPVKIYRKTRLADLDSPKGTILTA